MKEKHMKIGAPSFLAVDFYCGAGGTTRGLLDAGGYVLCGIDKDEDNRATYMRNNRNTLLDQEGPDFLSLDMFPRSSNYPEGQQHEVWSKLRSLIRHYRKLADGVPLLFVICAPCQSFTRFVQRRMTSHRRERRRRDLSLLSQTIGFIAEFKPEMIISENVASIKTGVYRKVWSDFEDRLRGLGYSVGEDCVCASRFGVPQYRRRSVLLGLLTNKSRQSEYDPPVPTLDPDSEKITAMDAIGHFPTLRAGEGREEFANHRCRNLTEVNQFRLMSVKPGEPNWILSDTPYGDLSLPCHQRLIAKGNRGFGDVYTRMRPDRPAPTLTTRFLSVSNGRFGHFDRKQVRGLSLREGAALQTFGDSYEFYGNNMDVIARMIGNAVPPKLSAFMANWLVDLWQEFSQISEN